MLTAPVSYHRLLFGQRRKAELVWASSPLAVGGLVLMLGVAAAVLLIADVVLGRRPAVVLTAGVVGWYVAFWYAVPLWSRRRGGTVDPAPRTRAAGHFCCGRR